MIGPPEHLHKMTPSWLFPYLIGLNQLPECGTGRWQYWSDILLDMKLPDKPIPTILFRQPHPETTKHIVKVLEIAERKGIRHSDVFRCFVVWLLHGLGLPEFRQYETPDKVPDLRQIPLDVFGAWYTTFNLALLLKYPADYMAHFAQGGENKNYNPYTGSGFFSTPMDVCRMMVDVTMGIDGQDHRHETVNDPACGTGSLLLAASNYSLRLFGQDISRDMVLYTKLNGYLYAPWMVWWPDFSLWGGPTRDQLEERIFGKHEPKEQPILIQLPLFALPEPVPVRGALDDIFVRQMIRQRLEARAGLESEAA